LILEAGGPEFKCDPHATGEQPFNLFETQLSQIPNANSNISSSAYMVRCLTQGPEVCLPWLHWVAATFISSYSVYRFLAVFPTPDVSCQNLVLPEWLPWLSHARHLSCLWLLKWPWCLLLLWRYLGRWKTKVIFYSSPLVLTPPWENNSKVASLFKELVRRPQSVSKRAGDVCGTAGSHLYLQISWGQALGRPWVS
jgi:hypothetical protein